MAAARETAALKINPENQSECVELSERWRAGMSCPY
jgi:hypothetical protein